MIIGFTVASYSIVGNDAIQTLGTFLASNEKRPWWQLWLFASGIMTAVLVYGWVMGDGDPAWGRLEKYPMPEDFSWLYVLPPLVLLVLTRFGLPVSTTFLVLTVFASKNLPSMLIKSFLGYGLAFVVGGVVYVLVAKAFEKSAAARSKKQPSIWWVVIQWLTTAYLWAMWLIQDLANIYVYLPRKLNLTWLLGSLVVMVGIQAYIFYTRGGTIQQIVTSKTNSQDIRSAALINFLFGTVLFVFKDGWVMWLVTGETAKIPMSTTWVFLGLLAGRELGINIQLKLRSWRGLFGVIGGDIWKAGIGLAVSVVIALVLPWAKDQMEGAIGVGTAAEVQVDPPATDASETP
ncbi:MAG: hypothetical protein AB8H79_26945 [Myxococcota bacterium]